MDADYITERFETGVLSPSVLQNYNVLILSAPDDNLSSSEINNIVSFVSNGGGLCFLGDAGLNENINTLLQYFGIQFEHYVICEPVVQGQDPGNPIVYNFTNHASLGTHPQFNMNWGGSFSVSSPAVALGFTDSTTWRDMNWNGVHDANEAEGPFTIVCAAEYENGRIYCVSDNAFHDDYVKWEQCPNDDLFLNALKWLTEGVNQVIGVELAAFTATVNNNQIELNWSTASEMNNFGFEVQRSQDKRGFTKIGFVTGNGTTAVPHIYSFIDRGLAVGTYYYRLKQIDTDGSFEYSPIVEATVGIPKTFELSQNYPNPFNPTTTIRFQLPKPTKVSIRVYDILGQEVKKLVDKNFEPGWHSVTWDGLNNSGRKVASGVYFYRMETKNFVKVRKGLFLK